MIQQQDLLSIPPNNRNLWAIVLAAGEGRRLAAITRLLCGRAVPKQFAQIDGERTLLQQTMDRLAPVVFSQQTVVVVARQWRELAEAQLASYDGVQIVSQPDNAGTGPGVLLPLSVIKAQCPDATVVVTPSDHHIPVRGAFENALSRAVEVAPHAPAGLALLGADADSPATDLGWMVPGDHAAAPDAEIDLVDSFVEKPSSAVARQLLRKGGLWNTLIVVGSVDAFWRQANRHMPRQTSLFHEYLTALRAADGRPDAATDVLARLYRVMPPADFSRMVLENADGLAVVRLKSSGWCDCGTPERILQYLQTSSGRGQEEARILILRSLQKDGELQPV